MDLASRKRRPEFTSSLPSFPTSHIDALPAPHLWQSKDADGDEENEASRQLIRFNSQVVSATQARLLEAEEESCRLTSEFSRRSYTPEAGLVFQYGVSELVYSQQEMQKWLESQILTRIAIDHTRILVIDSRLPMRIAFTALFTYKKNLLCLYDEDTKQFCGLLGALDMIDYYLNVEVALRDVPLRRQREKKSIQESTGDNFLRKTEPKAGQTECRFCNLDSFYKQSRKMPKTKRSQSWGGFEFRDLNTDRKKSADGTWNYLAQDTGTSSEEVNPQISTWLSYELNKIPRNRITCGIWNHLSNRCQNLSSININKNCLEGVKLLLNQSSPIISATCPQKEAPASFISARIFLSHIVQSLEGNWKIMNKYVLRELHLGTSLEVVPHCTSDTSLVEVLDMLLETKSEAIPIICSETDAFLAAFTPDHFLWLISGYFATDEISKEPSPEIDLSAPIGNYISLLQPQNLYLPSLRERRAGTPPAARVSRISDHTALHSAGMQTRKVSLGQSALEESIENDEWIAQRSAFISTRMPQGPAVYSIDVTLKDAIVHCVMTDEGMLVVVDPET
eukprot:GHVP01051512.1.p1 GENE.GHVP01051512.1~~GHVP01051512.1.p1  ORF type:complete len:565 (+),score=67.48 GHVP01051512.1:1074-2768(+)